MSEGSATSRGDGLGGAVRRLRGQLRWARSDGVRKFVEEKELFPIRRTRHAVERVRWRASRGVSQGDASPIWVLGVQRSGTNLLTRSLKQSMEIQVYSENHRRAFVDFRLRDDERIRELIGSCRHPYVLFKPLCDIDRAPDFLGDTFTSQPTKVIWAYRSVDGRVRSALARFGQANLRLMQDVAAGQRDDRWQLAGLGEEQYELISSFDWGSESAESAAGLFWYLRNDLLLRLGLGERPHVTMVSYDAFVADPPATLERVERFLGLSEPLHADAEPIRRTDPPKIVLHSEIRRRCDELENKLAELLASAEASSSGAIVDG